MIDPLKGDLVQVLQGDSLAVLRTLPASCVHMVMCSPPYWRLRSYLSHDHPDKEHELGSEPVPDCGGAFTGSPCGSCFICHLLAVFAEVRRVLRPDGVLCVNLGDTFATDEGGLLGIPWRFALAMQAAGWVLRSSVIWGKLAPMPESVSGWKWERCRIKTRAGNNHAGRNVVGVAGSWDKDSHPRDRPKAEYEPCPGCKKCRDTDGYVLRKGSWRPTRSHENVFVFTKGGPYWCDGDAVRTQAAASTLSRDQYSRITSGKDGPYAVVHDHETPTNPLGANLRDVLWTDEGPLFRLRDNLTKEQLKQVSEFLEPYQSDQMADTLLLGPESSSCAVICHPAPDCPLHAGQPGPVYVERVPPSWKKCTCDKTLHFAAFPTSLCEPFLKAFCPLRCCAECGTGWVRVVEREPGEPGQGRQLPKQFDNWRSPTSTLGQGGHRSDGWLERGPKQTTLGWRPACNCNSQAEPVPGLTMDVFSGTGTLALTARRMGLRAIGIELSEEYTTLSRERLKSDQPLFQ